MRSPAAPTRPDGLPPADRGTPCAAGGGSPAGSGPAAGWPGSPSWPCCCWSPLVAAGVWAVYFSSLLAVKGVDVTGATTGGRRRDPVRGARCRRASPWPPSTSTRSAPGWRRSPSSGPPTSPAQWPDQVLIRVHERTAVAVVEIGGRLRGMDADGVRVPRLPDAAARAAARPDDPRHPQRRARRRPPAWSRPCPPTWPGRSTTSRSRPSTRSRWSCGDGRKVLWGSADESDPEGRGHRRPAAATSRPRSTTSACPGSPRPADRRGTRSVSTRPPARDLDASPPGVSARVRSRSRAYVSSPRRG